MQVYQKGNLSLFIRPDTEQQLFTLSIGMKSNYTGIIIPVILFEKYADLFSLAPHIEEVAQESILQYANENMSFYDTQELGYTLDCFLRESVLPVNFSYEFKPKLYEKEVCKGLKRKVVFTPAFSRVQALLLHVFLNHFGIISMPDIESAFLFKYSCRNMELSNNVTFFIQENGKLMV